MKVLLVEDNRRLSSNLTQALSRSGYVVEQAYSGTEATHLLLTQTYDAVLLDLKLPGVDGSTVLKRIRESDGALPVMIISSRDGVHDIVEHMNLGADDYLTKPFDIEELEARLRSLLRRARGHTHPVISCGGLDYDTNSRRFSCAGEILAFPPREHAVLEVLIRSVEKPVSKKDIADRLCTLDNALTPRALEIYLVRIRKKLVPTGASIVTYRGLGYMLTSLPAASADLPETLAVQAIPKTPMSSEDLLGTASASAS